LHLAQRRSAFDQSGSRELVDMCRRFGYQFAKAVAAKLHGQVVLASRSPPANAVLLELISRLEAQDILFMIGELVGECHKTMRCPHGHKVLLALVGRWPEDPAIVFLVNQLMASGAEGLCCHKFGHSIANAILASRSLFPQKKLIVDQLLDSLQRFAKHRFASRVLECALWQHERLPAIFERLILEFLRYPESLVSCACHCSGNHVIRVLLVLPSTRRAVRHCLALAERRLSKDRYGKELLVDLESQSSI